MLIKPNGFLDVLVAVGSLNLRFPIDQLFPLNLVSVLEVFAKVNSAQFLLVSRVANGALKGQLAY